MKIRPLALYLIVCGFVQLFFKAFSGDNLVWFWVGGAVCLAITLLAWIVHFARKRRVKERKRNEEEESLPESQTQAPPPEEKPPVPPKQPEAPKRVKKGVRYYAVEGHENYYFAEYDDRYELFERRSDGDIYVRTDYKRK